MKKYIIDGNNLIGKSGQLSRLQKKDKRVVREKLIYMLERYFAGKNTAVSLHFDGFKGESINSSLLRIIYSGGKTADELIKEEIERSPNPRNIVLVTSDKNLVDFARVCACANSSSESFINLISAHPEEDEEKKRTDELNNPEEFKKLFGTK